MIQGLYQSAAAADGFEAWNNSIARNIAASATPGFKKTTVSFEGVAAGTLGQGLSGQTMQLRVSPSTRAATDFQPGDVRQTGDPLEFAIDGPGFFKLQKPNGSAVYTRDGQFHVASDGRLVSKQGYDVVGDSGVIQLLPDGGLLSVDAEGRVHQGEQEVGSLTLYTFPNNDQLHRANGGYVVDPNRPQTPTTAETSRIRQGCLEMSNVSAIREMADLVLVSNALQANQRVIQTMDELSQRAVQSLGATS